MCELYSVVWSSFPLGTSTDNQSEHVVESMMHHDWSNSRILLFGDHTDGYSIWHLHISLSLSAAGTRGGDERVCVRAALDQDIPRRQAHKHLDSGTRFSVYEHIKDSTTTCPKTFRRIIIGLHVVMRKE